MRLSTKGRYAVMAMADLAGHEASAKPVSLADIAARQEISLSYLEQLFAKLRRGGLRHQCAGPGRRISSEPRCQRNPNRRRDYRCR